ncbi:PHB depolymerase family esterase [Corynebacterium sp. HMSC034A01]|uniref:alpha/beta hydrolase family esterase n=1 Tax=Corynebacterium sp. HMSC034A01 TaxID=1739295 RepID=UPI0008A861A0|nr:hypothetical protein [Corynebacterium sp. HMSC034A01]OHR24066.1 hypothetical protein HMPREF2791_04755 [Corynebacterium sp. HMSC034A01]
MERHALVHQGHERRWIEVPGDATALLVVLHGSLQSGNVLRNFTDRTFEGLGPTVVYPDGVKHHFNDLRAGFNEDARRMRIDDVGFLIKLVERYSADTVIGCGFSNGGQMIMRLLFDAPGLLTGAATFGASMPTADNTLTTADNYQPTKLLAVQGTKDKLVPYDGGIAGIGGNNRGETRSALNSAEFFANLNGCTGHVTSTSEKLRVDDWTGEHPVRLVSLEGAGHMVPVNKDLDPRLGHNPKSPTGGELIREFFFA